ncbi:MAG: transcriptional repressor [Methylotenera sp.]|nr:transcriptional repressor [Oligoflexia bacterium]
MKAKNQTPNHCLSPNEIESRLKSAGVQPTAQRIAICRFVLCEAKHPTAEQVKAWADLNFPKISLATVYNTLGILVQAGLLKEYRFPHTESSVYDNNLTSHHHFLDEATGELIDIEPDQLSVNLKLKPSFKIKEMEILLKGTRS